jgi:hypothetical protein
MPNPTNRNLLLAAGGLSVVLWAVPVLGLVTLPLIFLNTHLHELCHALAGVLTGGRIGHIVVHSTGGGVTLIAGGIPLIYASAGYVGAAMVGALMIARGSKPSGAKSTLMVLAVLLALGMLLWVRGDLVGILTGGFWVLLLALFSRKLEGPNAVFAAQFLGMQQCLMAVQSLWVLLQVSTVPQVSNDAKNLQEITGLPAVLWAVLWTLIGLMAMGASLRSAWKG